jgi:hypothetical protein
MAGGADKTKPTVFSMKGGAIHNSDVNSEILSLIKNGGTVYMEDGILEQMDWAFTILINII